MCHLCGEAVRLLMEEKGFTEMEATSFLWEFTPFPFDTGEDTLSAVKKAVAPRVWQGDYA